MRSAFLNLITLTLFSCSLQVFSQDDGNEIKMSKQEWRQLYDENSVKAIILLSKLDSLSKQVDSLKQVSVITDSLSNKCENEIYLASGTTKDEVAEYRKKFDDIENKIRNKIGSPADNRKLFLDELSTVNLKCLPEFSGRYASLKTLLEEWEGFNEQKLAEVNNKEDKFTSVGTYTVIPGDCLRKISFKHYSDSSYWKIIWKANKDGVLNKDSFSHKEQKKISNPNLIYPGQILKIPTIQNSSK